MPWRATISRRALDLARRPWAGPVVSFVIDKVMTRVPAGVVLQNRWLVVLRHPRPVAPDHLVVVPRRRIPTLLDCLSNSAGQSIFVEMLCAALRVSPEEVALAVVNGGCRQEVHQLHLHVLRPPLPCPDPSSTRYDAHGFAVEGEPSAADFTLVLRRRGMPHLASWSTMDRPIVIALVNDIAGILRDLQAEVNLATRGYSLLISTRESDGQFAARIQVGSAIRS